MPDIMGSGGFATERQLDALGRVASVVAHELTNLLQILSSSLDRLPVADDPNGAMKTVRGSIDRGTRLARQLQTFAQTTPPRLQTHEIHRLMASWMPEFEDAIGPERRLELRLRHSGSIVVDAEQLQTALVNLLANARDASDNGAAIVLDLSRADRNGQLGCRIAVIDHGEGMTDEVARQAVAPFFTTRPAGKGMGLGLTIARMVAEAHGGSLEIDSAFGRGTTVSMHLMNAAAHRDTRAGERSGERAGLAEQAAGHGATYGGGRGDARAGTSDPWTGLDSRLGAPSAPSTHGRSAPPVSGPGAHGLAPPGGAPPAGAALPGSTPSGTHLPPVHAPQGPSPFAAQPSAGCVLVIDDEEAIAEYFRIILSAERYDVHVVCSAHQALDRFAEDPTRYDTVLLDMMLRDGSGIDLYRKFRQLRPDLPVVVCTGFSDNESLAPIRADGHDILFKPCPRGDVLKAVARAVARRVSDK
jgi:CheY-like chemotaxis protein